MARQSELDELRREVAAMREGHFAEQRAALDASSAQIGQTFEEIQRDLTHDGMAPQPYVEIAPPPAPEPQLAAVAETVEPAKASAPKAAGPAKPRARKAGTKA
jgi:sec-independent protein translocase protein TatB